MEDIKTNMAEFLRTDVAKLGDDVELKSLVRDSFVLVELVMRLQEDFSVRINQEDLVGVSTVGNLISAIQNKKQNS